MKDNSFTSTQGYVQIIQPQIFQKEGPGQHGCTQQRVMAKPLFQVKKKQPRMSKNYKDFIVTGKQFRSQKPTTKRQVYK